MGITYTSTVARSIRAPAVAAPRLAPRNLLLPLTSLVAILAIGLAYGGRVRTMAPADSTSKVINLNTIADARDLEPALAAVFTQSADRQFAARALFAHLAALRQNGGRLSNVGALSTAAARSEIIDQTSGLSIYPERLLAARQRRVRAGADGPATLSILTADELARLKPAFSVRTPDQFESVTLTCAALYVAAFYLVLLVWRLRRFAGDVPLLAAAHLLTAVGFAVVLARPDPVRDVMLVVRYTQGVSVGLGALVLVSLVDFRRFAFVKLTYVPLIAALLLSTILLLFGDGPGTSAAKVNLGPVQPIEAIRLLLAVFLAGYFARRWELLREIPSAAIGRYQVPRWLHLPRADYALPVLIGIASALLLFFLQKDLGPALLLSCVFLVMYAVATGRTGVTLTGCTLLVTGFYVGYRLNISTTLANRVSMWQSPWDNAVLGGDQIAQSIWALATGGIFGTGLGFGDTRYVPAGYTDLVLAAVGEELGIIGLLAIAVTYTVVTVRGLRIALRAGNDYTFFLAVALTLFLIVPAIVMAAGVLGVTPLTGVVTPFLSYGGSAMVANFAALGMLMGIGSQRSNRTASARPQTQSSPFRTPARYLGGGLAVATVVLAILAIDIQVLRADSYVVRPHLSKQADGVRRYQYNQRILDIAKTIPRGTIYDRRGLPLATSEPAVLTKSVDALRKVTGGLDATCVEPIDRCYPLDSSAFHLIGDATTRLNWAASNSSYVERDDDARLRGFDDHAASVASSDPSGQNAVVVRRDYRELVPLLRHRHDRDHTAVQRLLSRKRDLQLTIDARFQHRVATILAEYARKYASGKAAAVVLDAETGQLLAVASYPAPTRERRTKNEEQRTERRTKNEEQGTKNEEHGTNGEERESDALLDRARYGLYPPGSTFKLVTAAAALRLGGDWSTTSFMCSPLRDGRVGVQIPGWSRPVRDDVLHTHAHGRIAMHDAIVQSCNAYFAQLAVKLGPRPILETASRLGIAAAPDNSIETLRGVLAQAGYGQGSVVATPLRMARVAAAIANRGVLRDVTLEPQSPAGVATERLLSATEASRLASYMRDAVVSGSGRRLKDHPWRIAGKTGTGEVSGQLSHSWFVGFAPYGSAHRKIAFAVIIENAGYGGLAAAPAAGDIVSAAAAVGLIQ